MLHSIYDLTTYCRKTTGDVPPKLVGASTTVVDSKMYLFGGRLVTERRMVSDLYMFDLETFVWEKITFFPDDDVPRPRYFHSADAWENQLVIFGGMSSQPDAANPEDLCVLNDARFFDLTTRRWLPPTILPNSDSVPRGRYAHLSSVTSGRLFIIGGQDFHNTWLDDICVFDLPTQTWVQRREYPRHCGTYRSVAVSSNVTVRLPQEEIRNTHPASMIGPPGARFKSDKIPNPSIEATASESLVHLSYSTIPTEEHPSDIYLYSNYNFTDVKRELEVFSPLPDADFTVSDRSQAMNGSTFPPGLRFPTGAILGTYLIIAGTYLTQSYQTFSIWVLDLISMTWSRIDPGRAVEAGSWFRGCLWAEANRFLIFGNKNGNLVDDYNRRLLSWDHVAVVDLEAFGIYQPPPLKLDIRMQELGLAALEERIITDFEVICDDGRKILCSRKLLEDRWPWFKERRRVFLELALSTLDTLPTSSMHQPLPEIPGLGTADKLRLDPRLTPRSFYLSEPYPVTLALLQYFYSMALITPLQHAPAVLSQLLVLATNYKIDHLASLVKHAMHKALSNSTSVGVYEVATLCSCRSLQIRALRTVMSYTQKRTPRPKGDSGGGGGGGGGGSRPSDGPGDGSRPSTDPKYVARPRGTSDAKWRTLGEGGSGAGAGYNMRSGGFSPLEEEYEEEEGIFGDEVSGSATPASEQLAPPTQCRPADSIVSFKSDEILEVSELISPAFLPGQTRLNDTPPRSLVPNVRLPPLPEDNNFDDLFSRSPPAAPLPVPSDNRKSDTSLDLEEAMPRLYIPPPSKHHLLPPIYTSTHGSDTPPLITLTSSRSSLASSSQLTYDSHSSVSSSVPSTPQSHIPNASVLNDFVSLQNRLAMEHEIRLFDAMDDDSVIPGDHKDLSSWSKQGPLDRYSTVAESIEMSPIANDTSSLDSTSTHPRKGSFSRFLGKSRNSKGDKASPSTNPSTNSLEDEKKRLKREAKEAKELAKKKRDKVEAVARQHALAARIGGLM